MIRTATTFAFVAAFAMTASVTAQVRTQRGAVVGGLSGAAIGAIIGDHNDEAGAGAAIGGVIGAVAGGVLGNAEDQHAYGQPRFPAPRYPSQQLPPSLPASRSITTADVVSMSQNRVSDQVIITAIQNKGIAQKIDVPDIVYLSQQGVSDNVIRAMQTANMGPVVANPVPVAYPVSRPVIVEHFPPVYRHVYHPPYPRRPPGHYHYRTGHRHPRSGVSISFGL